MTHVVIHTTLIATTTVVLFLLWVIIAVTVHNKDMKNLEEINSSNKTATVYIVRHGEKTYGGGCLNIQGQERANHFPQLFNSTNKKNRANLLAGAAVTALATNVSSSSPQQYFDTPTGLFANNYFNEEGNCERCLLTVLPLSQALDNVPIDFQHGYPTKFGGNKAGATAIRTKIWEQHFIEHNDTTLPVIIVVAWEHYNIQFLTNELGVPTTEIPYWGDDDYDTVYVLTVQITTGKPVDFEVRAQNYRPTSTTCDPAHYIPPPGYNPPTTIATTTATTTTAVVDDVFFVTPITTTTTTEE